MRKTYTTTVHRVRAPMKADRYSSGATAQRDWEKAVRAPITNCSLLAAPTSEDTFLRESSTTTWTLRRLGDADLLTTDRVEARGITYEVTDVHRNLEGHRTHLVAVLKYVKG